MAVRERKYYDYTPFNRKKLPRNKYGLLDVNQVSGGSSLFGSADAAAQVGVEMNNISDFKGATRTEAGIRGLVPAPDAGENLHFLQGNGGWTDIPAFRWFKEFPEGDGFEKSGLTIDGDLNVKKNLSTLNLSVEGAAHFWSLIIDQVKASGGQLIVSPSTFHVDHVGRTVYVPVFTENSPLYTMLAARKDIRNMFNACKVEYVKCRRLYQRNDDGSKHTKNECEVGDMMRCRSFNVIKPGEYHDIDMNKDYWSFVADIGKEEYTDEENNTHSAFYIDLAYGLRLQNGHSLPLGTKLKKDGTYEIPEGFVEISDTLELKKKSQETLDGTTTVEEEYFDSVEFKEITDRVINIRGIADQINDIVG